MILRKRRPGAEQGGGQGAEQGAEKGVGKQERLLAELQQQFRQRPRLTQDQLLSLQRFLAGQAQPRGQNLFPNFPSA